VALLDQALTLQPADTNARLSRATILTVRGDYAAARADCQQISAQNRPDIGFLCLATTQILTANGPGYAKRLQAILSRPGLLDPQLHGWAMGLIAEIAIHQGDRPLAMTQLQAVLADNPLALRERVMLADLLLADGAPQAAMDLLAAAPDTDGVLIRRVQAARAIGDSTTEARLAAILDKRFKLNLDLGLNAHAREEGLYFLTVAHDPALALTRASVNWALQHEVEDAVLLLDAAEAAGQPDAAQPVRDWMAANAVLPRAK
jgi:tetratricopeptide (TPR) repeat protein